MNNIALEMKEYWDSLSLEEKKQFVIDAGIINKNGELTELYKK